jgi:hypothetical protein
MLWAAQEPAAATQLLAAILPQQVEVLVLEEMVVVRAAEAVRVELMSLSLAAMAAMALRVVLLPAAQCLAAAGEFYL